MSSMRSASSSTIVCTPRRSTRRRCRKSHRRPGVAMTICAPLRIWRNCRVSSMPPTTTAERIGDPTVSCMMASLIWIANSRVGLSTTARILPVPGLSMLVSIRSIIGIANARVFPVPVCAVATTSWPASAGGIACACTGVGVTKRCFARLPCSTGLKVRFENSFIPSFRSIREQRPAGVLLWIGNTCRSRSPRKRNSRVFSLRRSSCPVRL